MKNYARKTNRNVTRYRTPATFRVRAVMATQKVKGFNLSGKYQQLRTKFQNENSNINDPLVKPKAE
jgi:hypothetical protein